MASTTLLRECQIVVGFERGSNGWIYTTVTEDPWGVDAPRSVTFMSWPGCAGLDIMVQVLKVLNAWRVLKLG